ncbi:hypothetical protein OG609_01385 [Streptomyces sp. NBC_01224]|nr:hypothetical protein OG609_01385 [Streptomyces sp. NBC_01224]
MSPLFPPFGKPRLHRSDAPSRGRGRSPVARPVLFNTELIKRPWKTPSQVELATAEWVDWLNHRRRQGEIGYVPHVECDAT